MGKKKVGLLFPGQGSQYVGMGKSLYESYTAAREIFEIGKDVTGIDIASVCFDGPIEQLTETSVCQVAIFAVSIAAWRVLFENLTVCPVFGAGHSLGEYSAHAAAGTFSIRDGFALVARRAKFMKEASRKNPGAMVAVIGRTLDEVSAMVAGLAGVTISNVNTNDQIVVGGTIPALSEFSALCARTKVKVIPLKVSGAFHTPLMEPARELLHRELESIPMKAPAFPVYANCSGELLSETESIRQALVTQIVRPVLWTKIVEDFRRKNGVFLVELGPKQVLRNLVKKIAPELEVCNIEDRDSLLETIRNISYSSEGDSPSGKEQL
jgi:[acyl-carrier-protein] S-malonyltransferase